jgi:Fe-S cluster biogenesis protein NfuA
MASVLDRSELARRLASLNVLIRSHAGEIEIVAVSDAGVVTVRYTGMCAGCDYRPVTTAGTVEPALLDVPGVSRVVVTGARVSDEARERIQATLQGSGAQQRAVKLVRRMEAEQRQGEIQ